MNYLCWNWHCSKRLTHNKDLCHTAHIILWNTALRWHVDKHCSFMIHKRWTSMLWTVWQCSSLSVDNSSKRPGRRQRDVLGFSLRQSPKGCSGHLSHELSPVCKHRAWSFTLFSTAWIKYHREAAKWNVFLWQRCPDDTLEKKCLFYTGLNQSTQFTATSYFCGLLFSRFQSRITLLQT